MIDILIHHFADILVVSGFTLDDSIIFAANFVDEMSDEMREMEIANVTIH